VEDITDTELQRGAGVQDEVRTRDGKAGMRKCVPAFLTVVSAQLKKFIDKGCGPVNPILRDAISADITRAIAVAKSVQSIEHLGTRGRLREVLVSELLRPLLPTNFDIMTGILVDHQGGSAHNQSGQEDILIYSRDALPGGIRLAETGLLPIEACLAVIEVKSILTSKGIKQSIQHAERIKKLKTLYENPDIEQTEYKKSINFAAYPSYNVFSLSTDLTSNDNWRRFTDVHTNLKIENSNIFSACIVGTGMAYWHPKGEISAGLTPRKTQITTASFSEVIAFLSIISDFSRMRQKIKLNKLKLPALANYLL
jgi:hypothetical protein